MAIILSGCIAWPGIRERNCSDALPLTTSWFYLPVDQAKAQFKMCISKEDQPLLGLLSCPMIPVGPILLAFYIYPAIPIIAIPIDLVYKDKTCKIPATLSPRRVQ